MSLISNAHTVGIISPPTTLLAQIAAAMPLRSWVYMNGTTQNGVVCTRPTNFDTHFLHQASGSFQWGNRMIWNPVTGTIEASGPDDGTHDGSGGGQWARYVVSTNRCDSAFMLTSNGFSHLFERVTCNPYTGINYQSVNGFSAQCNRFASGAHPPFTNLPTTAHASVLFSPTDWWRGSLTGAGAQGALVMAHNKQVGQGYVDFYDPLSNSWFASTLIPDTTNDYNLVGAYSYAKNVFVFGDRSSPSRVWKVSGDRTCIRMANAPVSLNLYETSFIPDPITGNFIVHTNSRQFYEFNPDGATGTWTALPAAPNGSPTLGTVNVNGNGGNGVGAACVQDLGVIVYISSNFAGMQMHVYKHGA